jgi:hypothetical protein
MNAPRQILFRLFAILSLIAALYHLVGIFYPSQCFSILAAFAFCIGQFILHLRSAQTPQVFSLFFFMLMLQQFYSHGRTLLNQWTTYGKIDWISLLVMILLPVVFFNLIVDSRQIANRPE